MEEIGDNMTTVSKCAKFAVIFAFGKKTYIYLMCCIILGGSTVIRNFPWECERGRGPRG